MTVRFSRTRFERVDEANTGAENDVEIAPEVAKKEHTADYEDLDHETFLRVEGTHSL